MKADMSPICVAVLIVCFNGREYLEDCLGSVFASDDGDLRRRVLVVDNASTDGSREFVRAHFPEVELIESPTNLGFAGGNNLGWEKVRQPPGEVEFLVLLNQDTKVKSGWLSSLAGFLKSNPHAGAAQSKLLLHADPQRINTLGNRSHFLGFGFMTGYGEPDSQVETVAETGGQPIPVTYASGAAVMLRMELLEQVGLFNEDFFAYLEDAEICWKLRQIGFASFLVPRSVVWHKYKPTAPFRSYYLLERNRYLLLLTHYKLGTLVLLAPALGMMEAGQWLFSMRHGLVRERWRVVRYFLRPSAWRRVWKARRASQRLRRISDREFLHDFCGGLNFEAIDNPLLKYVGNPILACYWFIARRLIAW